MPIIIEETWEYEEGPRRRRRRRRRKPQFASRKELETDEPPLWAKVCAVLAIAALLMGAVKSCTDTKPTTTQNAR